MEFCFLVHDTNEAINNGSDPTINEDPNTIITYVVDIMEAIAPRRGGPPRLRMPARVCDRG